MSSYFPDGWVVVKINDIYKVFASFRGGFDTPDRWKLNSGIASVTIDEETGVIGFIGYSGSTYWCHPETYDQLGTWARGILHYQLIEELRKHGCRVEILPEETNWKELDVKE